MNEVRRKVRILSLIITVVTGVVVMLISHNLFSFDWNDSTHHNTIYISKQLATAVAVVVNLLITGIWILLDKLFHKAIESSKIFSGIHFAFWNIASFLGVFLDILFTIY